MYNKTTDTYLCPPNYILCGSKDTEEEKKVLTCIPPNNTCPITDISFEMIKNEVGQD